MTKGWCDYYYYYYYYFAIQMSNISEYKSFVLFTHFMF